MAERSYEEVKPITRREAELAFSSGEPEAVCDALVRAALNDPDWRWVQEKCLHFIDSPSQDVRGLAVTCLGHTARIHGTLDLEKVLPLLKRLRRDPDIGGRVEDALGDIKMFAGK